MGNILIFISLVLVVLLLIFKTRRANKKLVQNMLDREYLKAVKSFTNTKGL